MGGGREGTQVLSLVAGGGGVPGGRGESAVEVVGCEGAMPDSEAIDGKGANRGARKRQTQTVGLCRVRWKEASRGVVFVCVGRGWGVTAERGWGLGGKKRWSNPSIYPTPTHLQTNWCCSGPTTAAGRTW